ncbi:MAG: gamma-glutamyltransferase [Myxococcota bacterium]
MRRHSVWLALCLLLVAAPAVAQDAKPDNLVPETAPSIESTSGVVAADHPIASQVGADVLASGGNAADAGAAALLANGVVNPMSSGLGGGGFCLYRPSETGEVKVIDFREKAPKKADRDMFVVDGEVRRDLQMRGGMAVGVPGEPGGLWALQRIYGELAWKDTVEPAYRLANDGYEVGEALASRLQSRSESLEEHPKLAAVFKKDGEWVEAGEMLERPGLAKTLADYRDNGPMAFYHGDIADKIVEAVNAAGGRFQTADMREYSIAHREPITGTYRGHEIFSMPPPSSGGTTIVETLNILEAWNLSEMGINSMSIHLITEALKHAFADRARWLGDTDFVDVPVERLTSKEYAEELRSTIEEDDVLPRDEYGTHRQVPDDAGTTHLSVIDAAGNMLACTSTINTSFGSMVFVPEYGIVLNNEMGDFTPQPFKPNNYGLIGTGQNAVAPEKRPLSSMSPTLVIKDGKPFIAAGASGGPTIITGTLYAILRIIDFNQTPSEAIASARLHHQWVPMKLFMESPLGIKEQLESWGHEIDVRRAFNSVQIVVRDDDGTLTGVSDPRKSGAPAAADKK